MRKYLTLALTLPLVLALTVAGQTDPLDAWLDLARGTTTPLYRKPSAAGLKALQAKVLADLMAKPLPE